MNYRYVAYTRDDKKLVKGTIDGVSEAVATQLLVNQGYQPLTLKLSSTVTLPSVDQMFPSFFKIKNKDILTFTSQLATLLDAGITIVPALNLLKEEMPNRTFKNVIVAIINDIRAGNPF